MNRNSKQHGFVVARVPAGLEAFVLMAAVAHAYGQTAYRFKEIAYPGSSATYAYGVNDKGGVVGYYTGAGCSQAACGFTYLKGTYTGFECVLYNIMRPRLSILVTRARLWGHTRITAAWQHSSGRETTPARRLLPHRPAASSKPPE